MSIDHTTSEEKPEETLGSHFRNARTSLGKSLPEAAQVTCINPTILGDLESDNFTRMPAEVFTKGFIKLYAQYLGLNPEATIKLYINQEKLDLQQPPERPYRQDVLFGERLARPFSFFSTNPRMRIVGILLAVLLCFYLLGAILKVIQNRPGQDTPEKELARSLVDGAPPALPGVSMTAPAEGMGQTEITGAETQPAPQTEEQTDSGPVAGAVSLNRPFPPATVKTVPGGQPAASTSAETVSREIFTAPGSQPSAQTGGRRHPFSAAPEKSGPSASATLEETTTGGLVGAPAARQ